MTVDAKLQREVFAAQGRSFRGGLIENAARFQFIGSGYAAMPKEQNGYFDIKSARQVTGPLLAMTDDAVRICHIIGATQVLKSIVGELWVIYWIEHMFMSLLALFEDDGKADWFTSQRLMDTLRGHPFLHRMIEDSKKESRHNFTGRKFDLGEVQLRVAGLNEGNVSTISWPAIWLSEGWQHDHDGLISKAFKRTDRFPTTYKILNESQAGDVDGDLHVAVRDAHQVPLQWRCPACDGFQTWEWKHWNHRRPADFKPRAKLKASIVVVNGQPALVEEEPLPGSYAGMRFGKNAKSNIFEQDKDDWTDEQKARSAYWECIWCGHRINDTRTERMQICGSYQQEYKIKETVGGREIQRTPEEVCFTIPYEAAWDNTFEKTVKNFLKAKAAKSMGNKLEWIKWFKSDRGAFYNDALDERRAAIVNVSSYDPAKYRELMGERFHCVQMTVDCHQAFDAEEDEPRIGAFWFEIRAFEKAGHSIQLSRGWVFSWKLVKAQQVYWKVPAGRVYIDSAWMGEQVAEAAVRFHDIVSGRPGTVYENMKLPVTWFLCEGAKPSERLYVRGKPSAYMVQPLPGVRTYTGPDGRTLRMPLYKLKWNGRAFEEQLDSILSKGISVKWEWLSKNEIVIVDVNGEPSPELLAKSLDRERGNGAYEEMMASRRFDGKKYVDWDKRAWTKFRPAKIAPDGTVTEEGGEIPGRPTEGRDSGLMHLAAVAQDGLLGHVAVNNDDETN